MSYYHVEDLEVYQLAMSLADEIWHIVIKWSIMEKDTIGKQIIRSSDLIAANISEGYGRYHYKENKNFCLYSRGSITETKTWLQKARNRNLISEDQFQKLYTDLEKVHIKLNTYIKFIGKTLSLNK
jgi:four helix bundle protein